MRLINCICLFVLCATFSMAQEQPTPSDNRALIQQHFERGEHLIKLGDLDGAIAEISEVIRLDPRHPFNPHTSRGRIRIAKGDLDGAIDDFTKAIELKPKKEVNYWLRGIAKWDKNDLRGALTDFEKAAELSRSGGEYAVFLPLVLFAKGDADGAIAAFTKLLEKPSPNPMTYFLRGRVFLEKGEFKKAAMDFDAARGHEWFVKRWFETAKAKQQER